MVHARLLDIAIREFGTKGLEGASTRGIAAAADTAMSSITYHYGGKEGLYLAAADYIAEQMAADMAPALVAERSIAEGDQAGARAAIHRIVGRFIDKMANADAADRSLFILREQLDPSEAFDRIYAGLMGQMLERLVQLVCMATGRRDRRTAIIATITLIGQSIALRASRASVLRLLDIDDIDAATIDEIRAHVAANTDVILDRLIAEQQETP